MQRLYKIVSVLTIFFFFSCADIFSTRDVEEPDTGQGTDLWETPISYDVVLRNFRYAVIQKNVSNYMNCFIDSSLQNGVRYRFVPDQRLQKEQFENWTLDDESTYLRNVIFNISQRPGAIDLNFLEEIVYTSIVSYTDSVETNPFAYELRLDFGDSTAVFSGFSRMKLIKDSRTEQQGF